MAVPTKQDILDNAKTALNNLWVNGGVVEVRQSDGRMVKYSDPKALTDLIVQYEGEVAQETALAGNKPARTYAGFARRPR